MKLLKMLAVCAAAGTFTGCAIDYSQIVDHPAGAKPQDTISVSMINIVTVLSNSSRLIQRVTRDSLHVAMGLPQGWSVVSADCYIAEDTRLAKMIGSLEDTAATVAMCYFPWSDSR